MSAIQSQHSSAARSHRSLSQHSDASSSDSEVEILSKKGKKMSGGAIAGIAIGGTVVGVLVGGLLAMFTTYWVQGEGKPCSPARCGTAYGKVSAKVSGWGGELATRCSKKKAGGETNLSDDNNNSSKDGAGEPTDDGNSGKPQGQDSTPNDSDDTPSTAGARKEADGTDGEGDAQEEEQKKTKGLCGGFC